MFTLFQLFKNLGWRRRTPKKKLLGPNKTHSIGFKVNRRGCVSLNIASFELSPWVWGNHSSVPSAKGTPLGVTRRFCPSRSAVQPIFHNKFWCFNTLTMRISTCVGWGDRRFVFLQEVHGQPVGLWNIGKPSETMHWFIGFIEDWRSYTTSLRRSRGFGFSLRSGSNECLADLPGRYRTGVKIELSILEVWKSDPWDFEVCHPLLPRGSCLWPCIRSWDGCQLLVKHHAFHDSHLTHSEASIRN